MGGMLALDAKYSLNKPIELNEPFYYPAWYKGDKVAASRVEAWEFMVGGGGSFNHLNGQFTVANPRESQGVPGELRFHQNAPRQELRCEWRANRGLLPGDQ